MSGIRGRAWGSNSSGNLGDGTTTLRLAPVLIDSATTWVKVSPGDYHTLAKRSDGSLWAWGQNGVGALGINSTTAQKKPVQVAVGTSWIDIAAGGSHSIAIKSDGTLWGWGYNYCGKVGDGTTTNRLAPVPVDSGTTWQQVNVASNHSVALKSDGSLWAWGCNDQGQLGNPNGGTAPVTVLDLNLLSGTTPPPTAPTLTITLDGTGGGNINSVSGGINCTLGTCQQVVDACSTYTLKETPNNTSTFSAWNGCSLLSSNDCLVTMNSSITIKATFTDVGKAMIGLQSYSTLNAAYTNAPTPSTILLLDSELVEDLDMKLGKSIILKGGYNTDFVSKSGLPTTLKGKLKISSGTLIVDGLKLVFYDKTPPTVVSVSPSTGSTNVPLNSSFFITFSEEMAVSTINATNITLSKGGVDVPVTLMGYDSVLKVARFQPANLDYDTQYTIMVSKNVTNTSGIGMSANFTSTYTTQSPPIIPPATPTGLAAVANNTKNIISWNTVSGADSYNMYWSTSSALTVSTGTRILNVTTPYTHDGLTNGVTYYYFIIAVNGGGESYPTSVVSATPQDPPSPPINVVTAFNDSQNTISWDNVTGAVGYNIYWSTASNLTKANGTKISNVTNPYTHSNLTNETKYYYVVTAYDSLGLESAASVTVSSTPHAPPLPPTNTTAAPGNSKNTLSWTVSAGADGYNIYWSTSSSLTRATGNKIAGVTTPYSHSNLTNGITYYYIVTGYNMYGQESTDSPVFYSTPKAPPPPPTSVSAVGGRKQVTITWSSVVGAVSYNIYWSQLANVSKVSGFKISSVTSPYIHTGLLDSNYYYYVVTAVDANGSESVESAVQQALTKAAPGTSLYIPFTVGTTWSEYNRVWTVTTGGNDPIIQMSDSSSHCNYLLAFELLDSGVYLKYAQETDSFGVIRRISYSPSLLYLPKNYTQISASSTATWYQSIPFEGIYESRIGKPDGFIEVVFYPKTENRVLDTYSAAGILIVDDFDTVARRTTPDLVETMYGGMSLSKNIGVVDSFNQWVLMLIELRSYSIK